MNFDVFVRRLANAEESAAHWRHRADTAELSASLLSGAFERAFARADTAERRAEAAEQRQTELLAFCRQYRGAAYRWRDRYEAVAEVATSCLSPGPN